MTDEDADTPTCPSCGEDLRPFDELVEKIDAIADGHETDDVVNALCYLLGSFLAAEDPRDRKRLRALVNREITSATEFHVEEAASQGAHGLH